jgi:hypothetical protein
MSTSQCATDPGLADQQVDLVQDVATGASKLLKGLLIGFAATVTIALALASWYVGVRIVAANEVAAAGKIAPVPQAPAVAPATEQDSIAEAYWYSVPAQGPELYLEVASLGPLPDAGFVKRMEAKGYRARIEDRGGQGDGRILIGPFSGRKALEEAQRKLRSAGVLAMEAAR